MNYKKIIILVKTGIRETVCERGDGMGTTGQTVGWETVGNWADSGREKQSRREQEPGMGRVWNACGRERKTTWFPLHVPYRSRPDNNPRPDLYHA